MNRKMIINRAATLVLAPASRPGGRPADVIRSFPIGGPRNTGAVMLTRNWSLFLVAAGAFNWVIWPRFTIAIWQDQRAWSGAIGQSSPTTFLLVHAVLILIAVTVGTIILVLGVRGFLAARRSAAVRPALSPRGDWIGPKA